MNFQDALKELSVLLDEKMDKLLPEPDFGKDGKLVEAMRYSVLSPGKRLRPFLTVTSATLFGVSKVSALQTAAVIEFIHAYSLIHDDLPAMDNDDMRRGIPSCHKKFGEDTAILAGDALLTLAFEVLADHSTHSDSGVRCELITAITKAIGCSGMVGGQMLDMIFEEKDLTINEIIRMQRMKTGELFAVSCEAGAILGKASRNFRNALRGYAHAIGLAFQITDDLLDSEEDETNEQQRKRKNLSGRPNIVGVMGPEKAHEQAKMLIDKALSHLSIFDHRADLLRQIANFIIERKN